jgi:hypothetical protein
MSCNVQSERLAPLLYGTDNAKYQTHLRRARNRHVIIHSPPFQAALLRARAAVVTDGPARRACHARVARLERAFAAIVPGLIARRTRDCAFPSDRSVCVWASELGMANFATTAATHPSTLGSLLHSVRELVVLDRTPSINLAAVLHFKVTRSMLLRMRPFTEADMYPGPRRDRSNSTTKKPEVHCRNKRPRPRPSYQMTGNKT